MFKVLFRIAFCGTLNYIMSTGCAFITCEY